MCDHRSQQHLRRNYNNTVRLYRMYLVEQQCKYSNCRRLHRRCRRGISWRSGTHLHLFSGLCFHIYNDRKPFANSLYRNRWRRILQRPTMPRMSARGPGLLTGRGNLPVVLRQRSGKFPAGRNGRVSRFWYAMRFMRLYDKGEQRDQWLQQYNDRKRVGIEHSALHNNRYAHNVCRPHCDIQRSALHGRNLEQQHTSNCGSYYRRCCDRDRSRNCYYQLPECRRLYQHVYCNGKRNARNTNSRLRRRKRMYRRNSDLDRVASSTRRQLLLDAAFCTGRYRAVWHVKQRIHQSNNLYRNRIGRAIYYLCGV